MSNAASAQQRLDLGRSLRRARAQMPRRGTAANGWLSIVRAEFGLDDTTAWRYMKLAEYVDTGRIDQRIERQEKKRTPHEVIAGVYFAQGCEGGPIKIGESGDIFERLHTLQMASPILLRLVRVVALNGGPAARQEFERTMHRRLAEHRLHGEWFADCAALQAAIGEAQ